MRTGIAIPWHEVDARFNTMDGDTSEKATDAPDASDDEESWRYRAAALRVIVADDSASRCEKLIHRLKSLSVSVTGTASNTKDAVALSGKLHPNLILVDARIPPDGCVDAIRGILGTAPETTVVVTFQDGDVGAAVGALDAGAADIIGPKIGTLGLRRAIGAAVRDPAGLADGPDLGPTSLTAAEREILAAIASGVPQSEVPDILGISQDAVDAHVRSVLTKLHHQDNPGLR